MADHDDYGALQQPGSEYTPAQNPASPYGKGGKAPSKPTAPAGKSPDKSGEVTILAYYDWDPAITEEQEVKYLLDHKWHPSYQDYVEITGITVKNSPGDFIALMGMIAEYKPGSIKRLNFWTHSNRTVIGIAGHVVPGNVTFTNSIDDVAIGNYAANGLSFTVGKQAFTLDDVRSRFATDAIFVLYGCDVGFDPTGLLTALKDLLQVSVIGFKTENVYCPPAQTSGSKSFNRKGEKVGVRKSGFNCGTDSTRDWRSLTADPNAVRVNK
ncbi:MAG: hypothetical protein ACOH10_11090 [Rhodoglobus sp.]